MDTAEVLEDMYAIVPTTLAGFYLFQALVALEAIAGSSNLLLL